MFITPILGLVMEHSAGNASSADEALGSAFIMAPLLILLLVTAFIVFLAALLKDGRELMAGIILSLSSVPVILLFAWTSTCLAGQNATRPRSKSSP